MEKDERVAAADQWLADLQELVASLEGDESLLGPGRLRDRLSAVEDLDALLNDGPDDPMPPVAIAIRERLEAANLESFGAMREAIRRGQGAPLLVRYADEERAIAGGVEHHGGDGYDVLESIVAGVLRLDPPEANGSAALAPGLVAYQPTPARHVFDLVRRLDLSADDVFIDVGAGLGHVVMLVAILTRARCVGVELEAAYVDSARRCALGLNVSNATFHHVDAREADLSEGAVFYLYTPFTGTVLREVLGSIRSQTAGRSVRICTFGPCSKTVAGETWLRPVGPLESTRPAIFRSID